jgi:uncharacterized protein YyaL (SSP411 family)
MSENRLGRETSPYLLEHRDNPVHWWAWGEDALGEARRTGKPILLSIGYAACHWCHVMAHESFEDPATAELMNAGFVNIKVDREERPDLDAVYLRALEALGEHGGWPMTMFLDSDARPFWGGTYFPPEPRYGRPAFKQVLREVLRIYHEEPDAIAENAARLVEALDRGADRGVAVRLDNALLSGLTPRMLALIDPEHGGIAGAPKFPQWSFHWLLWRGALRYAHAGAREAVLNTLTHIAQGGIYDHLGGGFARYSVDARWLVPHFEKMLYDNALLVDFLCEAYRETAAPLYAQRIEETVGWLLREMLAPEGGFAASLDADSEGEEGRFYVWSRDEITAALGAADAQTFCNVYDVSEAGNWEGRNILNRLKSLALRSCSEEQALAHMRAALLARRQTRTRPRRDDKVLADWNGLAIAALTHAARLFERPPWLAAAAAAFAFVRGRMEVAGEHGARLRHAYRAGSAKAPATASDYANMILAAVHLFEATADDAYLAAAEAWCAVLDRHHWVARQSDAGGYATTADDTRDVIVRLVSAGDDAVPNANALMLANLVRLHLVTGRSRHLDRAHAIFAAFAGEIAANPLRHAGLLAGAFDLLAPQQVVVVAAPAAAPSTPLARVPFGLSLPGASLRVVDPAQGARAGKAPVAGLPTAYACLGPTCSPPLTDPAALAQRLHRDRVAEGF